MTTPGTKSLQLVRVSRLRYDRLPLNPTGLACAAALDAGADMPPIKTTLHRDGTLYVRDGRHRTLAHKLCGRVWIEAVVSVPIPEFYR